MDIPQEEIAVQHNEAVGQFEANVRGFLAVTEYRRVKNRIIFTHTEVPQALEGQGVGSKLAETALEYARQEGLEVMPLCPFIAGYLRRHPEYQSLVIPGYRY